MTDFLACRMCLAVNTRMYVISNTPLQEIYEKITDITLETDDGKAVMACYICYHRLRKCQGLIQKSLKADKLLRQILDSGLQVSVLSIALIDKSYLSSSLGVSPTQLEIYDPENQNEDVVLKNEVEVKIERDVDKEEIDEAVQLTAPSLSLDSPSFMLVVPEDPEPADSDDPDDYLPLKPKDESKPKGRPSVQKKVVKSRKTRVKKKEGERKGGRPRGPQADAREVILTKEEQLHQMLERSKSRNYTSSRYKCELCFKGFRDTGTYGKHMLRHDQRLRFECEICHLRYDSKKNLRSHAAKTHEKRYVCNKCEHQSMSSHEARVHDKWHEGHKYECKHCGLTYSKVTTYMSHIRIKHASDFVCGLCGFTFVSEKGIEVHKTRSHKPAEVATPLTGPHCADCGVTFASEAAHDRHLELSSRHNSGKGPKRLRNDMQVLNTKKRRRELRLAQGDADPREEEQEPITCEQCGLRLGSLALYACHFRRAHPGRNRTKYSCLRTAAMCELCGKIFQSRTVLEAHMWVHTGARRHKCPECERSYVHKNSLALHRQTHRPHHVRSTYECPICGKSFSLYSNRRRHMFTHTGFKSYQCESCGKGFNSEASRKAHMEHVHLKKPRPKRIRGPRQKTVLEPEN